MLSGLKFIPRDELERSQDEGKKERKKSRSSRRDKGKNKKRSSHYSSDEDHERIKSGSRKKKKWMDDEPSSSSDGSDDGSESEDSVKERSSSKRRREKKRGGGAKKKRRSRGKDSSEEYSSSGEDRSEVQRLNDDSRKAMGLDFMLRPKDAVEKAAPAPLDDPLEFQSETKEVKVNPRELNPYFKDNGSGYPEESGGKTDGKQLLSPVIGDGGASWRLKALKRSQEQAAREGRNFDEVVRERWGSVGELAVSAAAHKVAPVHAHLHAIKNRRRGPNEDERTNTNRQNEKDGSYHQSKMKIPKVQESLSWGKSKVSAADRSLSAAISTINKFSSDGSFMDKFLDKKDEHLGDSVGSSNIETKELESKSKAIDDDSSVKTLTANQLAAKVLQLRMKGKHEEAEKLKMTGRGRGRPGKQHAPMEQETGVHTRLRMTVSNRKKRQLEEQSSVAMGEASTPAPEPVSPWGDVGITEDVDILITEDDEPVGDWDYWVGHENAPVNPHMEDVHGSFNIGNQDDFGEDADHVLGHQAPVPKAPVGYENKLQRRTKGGRFACSSGGSCNDDDDGNTKSGKGRKKQVVDRSWYLTVPLRGGPKDVTVIPSFGGHIAVDIWKGKERTILRCYGRQLACQGLPSIYNACRPSVQERVLATGLAHLPGIMFKYLDRSLISAFIERWQPDTNSFHMPFGEMTIMLHDVQGILDIPIEGDVLGIVGGDRSLKDLQDGCAKLFGVDVDTFMREQWRSGRINSSGLMDRCVHEDLSDDSQFSCFMLTLVASTLFVDKSGGKVRPHALGVFGDPNIHASGLSWGSATLAYLYQQLGMASRAEGCGVAGCLTLLQAWIYEYFPMFRQVDRARTDIASRAWRWYSGDMVFNNFDRLNYFRRALDALQADQIEWMPFGEDVRTGVPRTHYRGLIRYFDVVEPYLPDRCVRQLGYVQRIPVEPYRPEHAFRPRDATQYSVSFAVTNLRQMWQFVLPWWLPDRSVFPVATTPTECTPDYMSWFLSISHPSIVNPDAVGLDGVTSDQRDTMLASMIATLEPVADRGIPDNMPPDWQIAMSTLLDLYGQYRGNTNTRFDN